MLYEILSVIFYCKLVEDGKKADFCDVYVNIRKISDEEDVPIQDSFCVGLINLRVDFVMLIIVCMRIIKDLVLENVVNIDNKRKIIYQNGNNCRGNV